MKHLRMRGWNVGVQQKRRLTDPDDQGVIHGVPIWILTFVEAVPPTGDTIEFEIEEDVKDVKDELVKAMTGGIEIAKGI